MQSTSIGSFTVVQYDTNKRVVLEINNVAGVPVDLTAATELTFTMEGPAFVEGAANAGVVGQVYYEFIPANTAVVGTYKAKFTCKIGGLRQTFPDGQENRSEYITVYVVAPAVSGGVSPGAIA